jgi:hypothetical protein
MSMSKRAYGVKGFEEYEDYNYICVVHGFVDRDDKKYDNSVEIIVDEKKEKVCPTCFSYKLNKIDSDIKYSEFKKVEGAFIPIK